MNEQTTETPQVARVRRISWLTIVLGLLTVASFLAISNTRQFYYDYAVPMAAEMGYGGGTDSQSSPAMPKATQVQYDTSGSMGIGGGMMPPDYYPSRDVPVTDSRELLKVSYSASMLTRDAQGLTRRVETTVRGYEGRIDQESSSPKSGYVRFVVPMSKYDAFRTELESLVDSRFLTVNISSQNLLPQKQSIEQQQTQADTALADYKTARQKLVTAHTNTVSALQAQISADDQQLTYLRAQATTPQLMQQIQVLSDEWTALKRKLSDENASYATQLKYADANITSAEQWQKAVKTQDQTLLDNVATVSGSVSIQWISLWDMAQVYLPGYWIPFIFAVLTLLSYWFDRRRRA